MTVAIPDVLKPAARLVFYGTQGQVKKSRRRLTKWIFQLKHRDTRRRRTELAASAGHGAAAPEELAVLEQEGFLDWSSSVDQTQLAALRAEFERMSHAQNASKDFFQMLTSEGGLTCDSPAVRLALEPRLIATAVRYFGEVPYLLSVDVIKSVRNATAPHWKKSQLWHKDHNDARILKMFIYLNDVDGGNGPFTFVPARFERQQHLPYLPVHKRDDVVQKFLRADGNWTRGITGPAGTAFLIDTARLLHCGSRIQTDRERLVYLATYTTFAQYVPKDNRIRCDRALSPLEQLLLFKTPAVQSA